MSSWLLMGLPGVAYLTGLAEASWTAIGLAVGTYLNWLIVARRIRRYSHQLDAITVPQFFSKRWGDERNLLSAIAAVVIIIFFIPYLASGFSACGKLFASLFGVEYMTAMHHQRRCHRDLYGHGRLPGGQLHRSDSVHHHDGGPGGGAGLRRDQGRRHGCRDGQRPVSGGVPVPGQHP